MLIGTHAHHHPGPQLDSLIARDERRRPFERDVDLLLVSVFHASIMTVLGYPSQFAGSSMTCIPNADTPNVARARRAMPSKIGSISSNDATVKSATTTSRANGNTCHPL